MNRIDFEKIHWGLFTNQWKRYKKANGGPATLKAFAHLVLSHPDDFSALTRKRANFYVNVIEK